MPVLSREGLGISKRGKRMDTTTLAFIFPLEIRKNSIQPQVANLERHYLLHITHLEPDILECEVKWALGSITMNKASGGHGITVERFQILKDDAVKVLHSI